MTVSASPAPVPARPEVAEGASRWTPLARRLVPDVALVVVALVAGSVAVAILEYVVGFPNGSPAFLLAVVGIAVLRGPGPAVATAIGAFFAYDFLFVQPTYTLTVDDPEEWLNLTLLLVVGVVVGRLAGRERDRAVAAIEREREARALFEVSFTIAEAPDASTAMPRLATVVRDHLRATRAWITVGDAIVADTVSSGVVAAGGPPVHSVLRRRPGSDPAEWVRVHLPNRGGRTSNESDDTAYRVSITAGPRVLGAIWAIRPRDAGDPDEGETRLVAAAADQIAGALERERLARDATTAEVSRRSEALKSALLDSVSHDLRTPLASIRAAAGTLMDPEIEWPSAERREIATSIDREAEWLNRLVTNLLDMSRVEAGELRPSLVVLAVKDAIDEAVGRTAKALGDHSLEVRAPVDLPPILADEVLLGQVLANTLDNAAKYAGPGAPIRVTARSIAEGRVRITIEDGGPGVPPEALSRLFEKFYRVPRKGEGSRRGTGIGLAVVQGIVDAMDGAVVARRSDLGGLAFDIDLPAAAGEPAGDADADTVPTDVPGT